jgi:hypothetical protein
MVIVFATSAVDRGSSPGRITPQTIKLVFVPSDDVRFVLDQHALVKFYIASILKQQSAGIDVAPLTLSSFRVHQSFCSFSLMLRA